MGKGGVVTRGGGVAEGPQDAVVGQLPPAPAAQQGARGAQLHRCPCPHTGMCEELRGEPGGLPGEKQWPRLRGVSEDSGRVPTGSRDRSGSWPRGPGRRAGRRAAVPEGKLCWAPVDPGQAQLVVGMGAGPGLLCNSCYPLLCAEQALD